MLNPGDLCYANSAFLCFLWALLSRANFRVTDWGTPRALFQSLLTQSGPQTFNLAQQPWFQAMLLDWEDREGQADSAEFTGRLIHWVAPACYNTCWHRRVSQGENRPPLLHDVGDRFMPLTVQIEPMYIHNGAVSLRDLLRCWHSELGMCAGFLTQSDLQCIHIDRFVQTPQGGLRKLHIPVHFDWQVDIPVFKAEDIDCRWEPYQVVAAFAHFGTARHGHYQALLRAHHEPMADPNKTWLHCDDGRAPTPCQDIPDGFSEGVTCLWLCHTDAMAIHTIQQHQYTNVAPRSTDDFLALIAESTRTE